MLVLSWIKRFQEFQKKIVLGTGTGYQRPPKIDGRFSIYSVRGPLTARALNLPPRKSIGDSAYLCLATSKFQKLSVLPKKFKVPVIPHHQTVATIDWKTIAKLGDIHFIDPRKNFFSVFEDIAQSECVLTESLHGAILADALRTPWQPFQMGHRFNMFKWHDWFKSIHIDIQAIQKYPILCSERLSRPRRAKHALERVCGKILMYNRPEQTRCENWRLLQSRYKNRHDQINFISAMPPLYKAFWTASLNVLRACRPNTVTNCAERRNRQPSHVDDQPKSVTS